MEDAVGSVWAELMRRNVVKVAAAYAVVGWLLVQVAATFFPALRLPEWTVTLVASLIILGFPLALILSWAYELTPDGMVRSGNDRSSENATNAAGRKIDFAIIGGLILALGFVTYDNMMVDDSGGEAEAVAVLPNSVAVLVCDNLSPDPADAYFAEGIHEEILNQLVKIRSLNVIARTSVLQYADAPPAIPQIAEELNVGAVMECSVRYAGDSILVTAQLIDPETNSHLWSNTYPGDLSDLSAMFAMQADIAISIADALEAEFSLAEQQRIEQIPTNSPAAYQLYLKARTILDRTRMATLDEAIALDPEFGLALGLRALSRAVRLQSAPLSLDSVAFAETVAGVKEDAAQALALDETIGMAHSALASVHIVEGNLTEARAAFERASALTPNEPYILATYAQFNRYVGEYADAIRLSRRSVELNPNELFASVQLGLSYWNAHDYDAAATIFRRFVELAPVNQFGHLTLGFVEASRGNHDLAVTELQTAEQLARGELSALRLAQSAFAYSRIGREEDAARLFGVLEDLASDAPVPEAVWAMAYCAIADYDEAHRRLVGIVDAPPVGEQFALTQLKANAFRDPVLDEPRWLELRDRIGALD
jgi:TolB-like protein/Flp pilus assembly protein TadD